MIGTLRIDSPRRFYKGDTLAARLESYLMEKGVSEIGEASWRKTLEIKVGEFAGDIRAASMEPSRKERAYRSRDVQNLSQDQLETIIAFEQKYLPRLLIGPRQMRMILKLTEKDLPNQTLMSEVDLEQYVKISDESNPPMKKLRDFQGFESGPSLLVPPYFVYDNSFDGMNFHHAIDRNVWLKSNQ